MGRVAHDTQGCRRIPGRSRLRAFYGTSNLAWPSALDVSSGAVVSLNRIRNRVPLVVFILLLILLVVVLGVICVCATDHPAQALERALSVIPAAPPLAEMWSAVATLVLAAGVVRVRPRLEPERASPAALQRFLF